MAELVSVLVYATCGLTPLFLYLFFKPVYDNSRWFFYFFAYCPTTVFAFLRGTSVGTDTENYRDAFEIFDSSTTLAFSVDYLFNLLIYISKFFDIGFYGFSVLHAALCLVVYSLAASRVDRVSPVFGLGLLPVLFIDSTFNGLRYGIGFAFAALAISFYVRSKSFLRFLILIPPSLFHSSLLSLAALSPFLTIFAILIGVAFLQSDFFYFVFFLNKMEVYSEFSRPSGLSGLMPIANFLMFYLIYSKNSRSLFPSDRIALLAAAVFFAGVGLSLISYAGLRILQIGVLFIAIAAALSVKSENESFSTRAAVLIGLLSLLNFYRQIFLVGPAGEVYFHPYVFMDF